MSTEDLLNPEDIVISGISGAFPNCDNVAEFKDNLIAGKDMVSDVDRYNRKMRVGLLKTIDHFDHSFFHITHEQVQGYNPKKLKGENIGVICGYWDSFGEGDPAKNTEDLDSYILTLGRTGFMLANRISYCLDFCGPSVSMNTACSSSMLAFDYAFHAIKSGRCEAALVIAPNFCLAETECLNIRELASCDYSGISAPFDASAHGYTKAEAVVALFLQKRKDARRIYANVLHTKTICEGFKEEGYFSPSVKMQTKLYTEFYHEVDVNPENISYIEAHGTGTQVGDVAECTSIEEFFCAERKTALKVGSVKSNMGHSEAASALCSLVKLAISFETGMITPNINYINPNPKIKGLHNGHLRVISELTPVEGEYYAMNSFGAGGSIGHILLTPHHKLKLNASTNDNVLPRLVVVSGRTKEAVDYILNDLEKNSNDVEYIRLFHEIFSDHISGHLYRGFTMLNGQKILNRSSKSFSGEKCPVWFVFGGMGSQWPSMGKSLMSIPLFANSICKSHQILLTKQMNLMKIITDDDPRIFDNILHCFVGIAAIQIALVDLLTSLGITPDGIIGHSAGELGCAYADGCLTAEQVILAAYYRGLVSVTGKLIPGAMAAVHGSYKGIKDILPPEIDIACHNSSTNYTISGPSNVVKEFINTLKAKNIFVREVNSGNIAYHSRYIASIGPQLESYLKQIVLEPKLRSNKWISTSTLQHEWNLNEAKYSSARYLTNNLLSSVYFEESCRHIPSNAITVEIGPHGLLNAILKNSLPSTVENIRLTLRNHENGVEFLLNALGHMYELGCELKLSNLYPNVEFPVSRSTPMISPLIKWQHDEQWPMGKLRTDMTVTGEKLFIVNPNTSNFSFVADHILDGINLYPGLGYIALVWETVAVMKKKKMLKLPIIFENVRFERATIVPKKGAVRFRVAVHMATHNFEVTDDEVIVASGIVRVPENIDKEMVRVPPDDDDICSSEILPLCARDFYKELRLRGYHYKGIFRNVIRVNAEGTRGKILWNNNMVAFMDTMAQISILRLDYRQLMVPTFIRKIAIDVNKHFQILESLNSEKPEVSVHVYPDSGLICAGGIQMRGWKMNEMVRRKDVAEPVLEKYLFVPYINDEMMDLNLAVRLCVQIALENIPTVKVKTYEIYNEHSSFDSFKVSISILNTLRDLPLIETNINVLIDKEISSVVLNQAPHGITVLKQRLPRDKSSLIMIMWNIQNKTELFGEIFETLKDGGFIIAIENLNDNINFTKLGFNTLFSRRISDTEKVVLLCKKTSNSLRTTTIKITSESYSWISDIRNLLTNVQSTEDEALILYSQNEVTSGILGFFNCLRKEKNGNISKCFFILDDAPEFSMENSFYKRQLDKNLSHNVYKNGKWGSYRHFPIELNTEVEALHAICAMEELGNLSSFRWLEGPLDPFTYQNSDGKSLVHIYYSSLNFKDVMLAVRKISVVELFYYNRLLQDYEGFEYSGRNENGERIMGILTHRGKSTIAETLPELTWKVPHHMTLEDASTIPIVYTTVIVAFFIKMNIKKGSSILIHAASGAIGQAAINICLHYQCNIFATVGTSEKVEFIRNTYPQIPASHIGCSRDTSFEDLIMKQTVGKGVDVVLNSLSEEKLRASVRCVAKGGNFLEIGKFDMMRNNPLELGNLLNNISFHSVQLDILMWDKNAMAFELIGRKFQEMLDNGIIKPIKRTVFQINEVESAFRYMAAGKHMGKVVIKLRDEEKDLIRKPSIMSLKVKPRVFCQKNESYVIVGGLGGFGMELADWLILRGARNIVLSSRTGIKNGYQLYRIKIWRSYGVEVIIFTEDITKENGARNLLQIANSFGPVTGIFNVAVILEDNPISNQTENSFETVAGPKAVATLHLDQLSRQMCPELKHFVVFSSVSCGRGNQNQTNYSFANSIMERICEMRYADNLPALAIQWGAIGEVGIVADLAEDNKSIVIGGTLQQKVESCLKTLNSFMKQQYPIVSSMVVAEKRHMKTDIISAVANILGIKDLDVISPSWTLPELGMDSILALELKQVLELEFNMFFTLEDIRSMTFAKLHKLNEEKQNDIKPGTKITTALQYLMNEDLINETILRIPFEDKDDENNSNCEKPTVFFFPGVEGIALGMDQLAKNLNVRGFCFQYHYKDVENSNFQKLCECYSSIILQYLGPDDEFYIVGHSLGGLFSIQVAGILEKAGRIGCIWLIDSSPSLVHKLTADHLKNLSVSFEDNFQNNICAILMQILIRNMDKTELFKSIERVDNWQAKKKLCFSMLPPNSMNENVLYRIFDRIYNLHKVAPSFQVSLVHLKTSCVLIRCSENKYDLDESYGLNEYFENPVTIHRVNAEHSSIIMDKKTAEKIMEKLPI